MSDYLDIQENSSALLGGEESNCVTVSAKKIGKGGDNPVRPM